VRRCPVGREYFQCVEPADARQVDDDLLDARAVRRDEIAEHACGFAKFVRWHTDAGGYCAFAVQDP